MARKLRCAMPRSPNELRACPLKAHVVIGTAVKLLPYLKRGRLDLLGVRLLVVYHAMSLFKVTGSDDFKNAEKSMTFCGLFVCFWLCLYTAGQPLPWRSSGLDLVVSISFVSTYSEILFSTNASEINCLILFVHIYPHHPAVPNVATHLQHLGCFLSR